MNEKNLFIPEKFSCRMGCAACCIAPFIRTSFFGMPQGKPAGVPCIHLDEGFRCRLYGRLKKSAFCVSLLPSLEMCGQSREAMRCLPLLEESTRPGMS